jgi:anti-sigma factor RsiW
MRCRQVKSLMPAHFTKELSEADRRALETHLADCSACHTHWRRLYRVELRLQRASETSTVKHGPSADFTGSVMALIAARQQSATNQDMQTKARAEQAIQKDESQARIISPLGPWSGWNVSLLGVWRPSPRMALSGALLAVISVMVGVFALGFLLTQPDLAARMLGGATELLAGLVTGIYSLVSELSILANNQLLLAGVAAGYVVLAVLWFRLMRHQEHEEVES